MWSCFVDLALDRDHLIEQALAPSTRRVYNKQVLKFKKFCSETKFQWPQAFKNEAIELWLTHLKNEGAASGTIRSHLSALRNYSLVHKIKAKLDTPRIKLILKGIQRQAATRSPAKNVVTTSHLRRLINASEIVHGKSVNHDRFVAMICLAFYGFLRPSEFCVSSANHAVKWNNVKVGNKSRSALVTLETYKHSLQESVIKLKANNTCSCPIKWLLKYKNAGPSKQNSPLFNVTVREFQTTLEKIKNAAKIKTHLTPHCFRHGGATWASNQGWPDAKIKAHGRWKSNAYTRYVRAT